jgi:CubicO group peptidase (beta-lactamase class C family)
MERRPKSIMDTDGQFWEQPDTHMDNCLVDGHVARGLESVADTFRENFRRRGELGAAFAVYRGAECLVDLWGGIADRASGASWKRDTVVLVFSTTKGLAGMTMAVAHARGLFEYDEPIARYWPEFAQNGKEAITVRQLLCHQAGLAAVDERLTPEILANADQLDAVLAKQRPAWTPGERHGYHATSLGLYQAGLLRHCDSKGRGVSAYFADEIANPLDLNCWIGLPREFPGARMARIDFRPPFALPDFKMMPLRFGLTAIVNPWSLAARAVKNPKVKGSDFNNPLFLQLEHPSTIGVGEVRAIARAYAEFASGCATLGIDRTTLDSLEEPATPPPFGAFDVVLGRDSSYSLGFRKPTARIRFGTSDRAYGCAGYGGSFGFADPDLGLGMAYAPNKMGMHIADDPREKALRDDVYRCLNA